MLLRHQLEVHGNFLFKYRGELPVLLIVPGLFIFYYQITSTPDFDWANFLSWYKFPCLAVVLLGQAIRAYAIAYAAAHTSGRNIHGQLANVINHTGLYSCVRHPLYVGNFFMALGVAMLSCNAWFVLVYVLVFWIYYERIIYAEEHFISQKFTDDMNEWATNTSTFIPAFSKFKKPESRFNWKKIIRQEKNGILAAFGIFFIYNIVENVAIHGKAFMGFDVWSIAFVASIVYYLIIRYLNKKTKVLEGD
jgi:protein-S-isoprenylcysteine O-methyltransferase Ste14